MSAETSVDAKVAHHFHLDAQRFDAIYDDKKGPFARFVDNVWRGVVRRRLDLTIEKLAPLAGMSVLDVGCGSGRFCFAFAQHGASRVLGVDFAEAMIDIARKYADELKVADRCEFRVGRFPEAIPETGFDASTAGESSPRSPVQALMATQAMEDRRSTLNWASWRKFSSSTDSSCTSQKHVTAAVRRRTARFECSVCQMDL